jgi:class 3 adenylate cyclase
MHCESCGHENPATNRFCGGCGAGLARACPACAYVNPPDHRFCGACGAALRQFRNPNFEIRSPEAPESTADNAGARKIVTIVFADLIGSTALHERLDAESVRRLMDRYYRALRGAVETHGGTVVKLMGDGVMAAFGVPHVAEDDAIRAVRAGVAMQHAFRELARAEFADVGDIGLRVGINTGEVVVSANNTDVVGDPANVAARLQQEAGDGEVVIGESTRRLVSELVTLAPLGAVTLKGRAETVAAYRVVSLERPVGTAATAFVGRDDELRRIMAVYDAAVAAPGTRLAVILGSPGLGKSRLLEELGRRVGDGASVLTAHCESAGGATFAPLAKAVRTFLRIDADGGVPLLTKEGLGEVAMPPTRPPPGALLGKEGEEDQSVRVALEAAIPGGDADRARVADGIAALLAGTPRSPEETFFVVRRFLTALATTRPVVLAIDDLQWAEPLLLDLVEHLVQWGKEVPLLVLAAARPELRDTRSSLTSAGGLVADVVTLGGLDAVAASRLAANVIGAEALPAAVAGRVLATSEGNPLFLGELVRMLVNDGALKQEGDRWTTAVDLAALDMPPTIHALLAARIERLRPEDCTVLERAAVIGRQFSRTAVAHLLPREIADLDARLEALRRSELIEPDTGWFLGEPALRFHHGLTRDAAYRRVLKGTRAELHGRLADWIETRVGGAIEHDETLGWHLEQAHQHLRELGPIDASGRAFGERAARYLAAAGRRALARDDLLPAANLLGRALDRLDAADPTRADLAIDWCEALLAAGDVTHATPAIDELARLCDLTANNLTPNNLTPNHLSSRLRAWHTCFTGQLAVLTDPQALRTTSDAVAAAADALAAVGDAAGEAKGHFVHATALQRLGKVGACETALDRALQRGAGGGAARRAVGAEPGDTRQRPLPRRRTRAAHHARRTGGRGRRVALSGGARSAARAH